MPREKAYSNPEVLDPVTVIVLIAHVRNDQLRLAGTQRLPCGPDASMMNDHCRRRKELRMRRVGATKHAPV